MRFTRLLDTILFNENYLKHYIILFLIYFEKTEYTDKIDCAQYCLWKIIYYIIIIY